MNRTGAPGFKRYFKIGPICADRVGSWDSPAYPLFGAWRYRGGFAVRFRAWIVAWQ